MATTSTRKRSRRSTVNFTELRTLVDRRRRSSYPQDAKTERAYWLRQIQTLLGDND